MDTFVVRETMKFLKNYAIQNGPVFLELDTYRYQGHSMSDPGISYRNREEVVQMRKERDCIEKIRNILLDNKLVDEKELKV